MQVGDLSVEHIERLHGDLKRTPVQANRVLVVLGRCLSLAERWGLDLPRFTVCPLNRGRSSSTSSAGFRIDSGADV